MPKRKQAARLLEESDIVWLQERYRRLSEKDPELTLEAFAMRYGLDPSLLACGDLRSSTIRLYHGTTVDRAIKILEEGFRTKKGSRKMIWFASQRSFAQRVAQARARMRNQTPVVFECSVDLGKYTDYNRAGSLVYSFKHERIYPDVILHPRKIKDQKPQPVEEELTEKEPRTDLPDICLTSHSGTTGIAFWLNAFLKLEGEDAFLPDSPVVIELEAAMTAIFDAEQERLSPKEIADIVQEFLRED